MQILLTEAEHDKLKSAAEGGEIRARELFKTAMAAYNTSFSNSFHGDGSIVYNYDSVRLSAVLEAHRKATDAAKNAMLPEIKS